jgi:hypothetical protein
MHTQALSTVSTLGDLLENITFLGLGLLILIVALAICQFFVNSISKVFAETSDRIEGRSTQRKRRRHARSRKHSHLRIVSRNSAPTESPNAFRALARSVNRAQQGQPTGTSGTKRFS